MSGVDFTSTPRQGEPHDQPLIRLTGSDAAEFNDTADGMGIKAIRVAQEALTNQSSNLNKPSSSNELTSPNVASDLIGIQLNDRQIAYYKPTDFNRIFFLSGALKAQLPYDSAGNLILDPTHSEKSATRKLNFFTTLMKEHIYQGLINLLPAMFKSVNIHQKLDYEAFKKEVIPYLKNVLQAEDFSSDTVDFLRQLKKTVPGISLDIDRLLKSLVAPFDKACSSNAMYDMILKEINRYSEGSWSSQAAAETLSDLYEINQRLSSIFQKTVPQAQAKEAISKQPIPPTQPIRNKDKSAKSNESNIKTTQDLSIKQHRVVAAVEIEEPTSIFQEIWNEFKLWLSLLVTRPSMHIYKILHSSKISKIVHESLTKVLKEYPRMRIDNADSLQALVESVQQIPHGGVITRKLLGDSAKDLIDLARERNHLSEQIAAVKKNISSPSSSSEAVFVQRAIDQMNLQVNEISTTIEEILKPAKDMLKVFSNVPAIDINNIKPISVNQHFVDQCQAQMMARQKSFDDTITPLLNMGQIAKKAQSQIETQQKSIEELAIVNLNHNLLKHPLKGSEANINEIESIRIKIDLLQKTYEQSFHALTPEIRGSIEAYIQTLNEHSSWLNQTINPEGIYDPKQLQERAIEVIINRGVNDWPSYELAKSTMGKISDLIPSTDDPLETKRLVLAKSALEKLLPRIEENCDLKFVKAYLNVQGGKLWFNKRSGDFTPPLHNSQKSENQIVISEQDGASRLAAIVRKRASKGFHDFHITKELSSYAIVATKEMGESLRKLQENVEMREFAQQFALSLGTSLPLWQKWTGETTAYICSNKKPFGDGWKQLEHTEAIAKGALLLNSRTSQQSSDPVEQEIISLRNASPVLVWDTQHQKLTCLDRKAYEDIHPQIRVHQYSPVTLSTANDAIEEFFDECNSIDFSASSTAQINMQLKKALSLSVLIHENASDDLDSNQISILRNNLSKSIHSLKQIIQDKRDGIGDQLGVLVFITEYYRSITNKTPLWKHMEGDIVKSYLTSSKPPNGTGWVQMKPVEAMMLFPRLSQKWATKANIEQNDPLAEQLWLIAGHISPIILWDKSNNTALLKDRELYDSYPPIERATTYTRASPQDSLELAVEFIDDCETPKWPPSSLYELEETLKKGLAISVLLQKASSLPDIDQKTLLRLSTKLNVILNEVTDNYRVIASEAPRLAKAQKLPEELRKEASLLEELQYNSPPGNTIKIFRDPEFGTLFFASKHYGEAHALKAIALDAITIAELRTVTPRSIGERLAVYDAACKLFAKIDHPSKKNDDTPYVDRLFLEKQISENYQSVVKSLLAPQNRKERLTAYSYLETLLEITKEFKAQLLQNRDKVAVADPFLLEHELNGLKSALMRTIRLSESAPPEAPVISIPVPAEANSEPQLLANKDIPPKPTLHTVLPQSQRPLPAVPSIAEAASSPNLELQETLSFQSLANTLKSFLIDVSTFPVKVRKDIEQLKLFKQEIDSFKSNYANNPISNPGKAKEINVLLDTISMKIQEKTDELSKLFPPAKPLKPVSIKSSQSTKITPKTAPKLEELIKTLSDLAQKDIHSNVMKKTSSIKAALIEFKKVLQTTKLNRQEVDSYAEKFKTVKAQLTEAQLKVLAFQLNEIEHSLLLKKLREKR